MSEKKALRPSKAGKEKSNVNMRVVKTSSRVPVQKEKQSRTEILQLISEQADLNRVQVEKIFDVLAKIIKAHLNKRGSGEITVPKLGIKLKRYKKKASKSRTMVSPLIGKEVTIKAKPARYSVKLSALKILKDMVDN